MELVLLAPPNSRSRGLKCLPRLPDGSLPYACMLGSLLLCISMMLPFSSPNLCILHLYRRNVIGSVIYFRVVKPQTVIHSTRNFNSYNQATEGFLLPSNSTPSSLNLGFMGSYFMLPTISPL